MVRTETRKHRNTERCILSRLSRLGGDEEGRGSDAQNWKSKPEGKLTKKKEKIDGYEDIHKEITVHTVGSGGRPRR